MSNHGTAWILNQCCGPKLKELADLKENFSKSITSEEKIEGQTRSLEVREASRILDEEGG